MSDPRSAQAQISKGRPAWVVLLILAALVALGWGGCFAVGGLLLHVAVATGCGRIGEAPDCPLGVMAMTLLMFGAFGGPLFLLGIVGCLLAAIISFLFGSKSPNRLGLLFCKGYLCLMLICVCLALPFSDPFVRIVVRQIPIMLQISALSLVGVGLVLTKLPLMIQYVVIVAPTLLLLYISGCLVSRARGRESR